MIYNEDCLEGMKRLQSARVFKDGGAWKYTGKWVTDVAKSGG